MKFTKNYKDLLLYTSVLFGFIGMYITFIMAYFSDGKNITIYINKFGEANIELFIFTIIFILGIKLYINKIKEVANEISN